MKLWENMQLRWYQEGGNFILHPHGMNMSSRSDHHVDRQTKFDKWLEFIVIQVILGY